MEAKMTGTAARSGPERGALWAATLAAVALYACLMGFLVLALYQEDHTVNVPLLVLFPAGIATAAVLASVHSAWARWLAVVYALVTTIADAPHQLAEVVHPSGHAAVSTFILLVGLTAIVLSVLLALRGAQSSRAAETT
jgi:hypothetical protein